MPTGVYQRTHRYGYRPGDPTRRCYSCKEEKPVSEYSPEGRRWDKLKTECKTCRAAQERADRERNPHLSRARSARYKAKDPEAYNARKRDLYEENVEKERARGRAQTKRDPKARHRTKRLHRYGITQAQYDEMRRRQGDRCAICDNPFTRTPTVDHCHSTGVVRGLLCRGCNGALGYVEKDGFLDAALAYLSRTKAARAA